MFGVQHAVIITFEILVLQHQVTLLVVALRRPFIDQVEAQAERLGEREEYEAVAEAGDELAKALTEWEEVGR